MLPHGYYYCKIVITVKLSIWFCFVFFNQSDKTFLTCFHIFIKFVHFLWQRNVNFSLDVIFELHLFWKSFFCCQSLHKFIGYKKINGHNISLKVLGQLVWRMLSRQKKCFWLKNILNFKVFCIFQDLWTYFSSII